MSLAHSLMHGALQDLDELLDESGNGILIDRSTHGGMHAHVGNQDLRVRTRDNRDHERNAMAFDGRFRDSDSSTDEESAIGGH